MYFGKKIVVVMPAYNAAKTVTQTVDEVLQQGVVDEIILVDDHSRDDTVAVASSLLGVRVHVHTQHGYGSNQKTCYRLAIEVAPTWSSWSTRIINTGGMILGPAPRHGSPVGHSFIVCILIFREYRSRCGVQQTGLASFRPKLLFKSAAEGLGFSFACSTTSVYNDIDKTMLSRYGMAAANGIYSMAYRVVDISCVPIRAVHSAAFPRFCQKGVNGVRGNMQFALKIVQKTVPFALLAAAGMFLCAPLIPLVIGKGFEESVSALRWLCLIRSSAARI